VQLQEQISEIIKLDTEVIAISTSGNQKDVEKSKRVLEITYILIPMPNGKIAKEYGLKYDSFGAAYATIILDKKGQIRFKSVEEYATRTSASRIIKELQGIQ
jgi:alkyl hydroperoxide reductase subunit AhpC